MYNSQSKNIDLVREYFPSYHTARFQDQAEPNLAVQDNFIKLTLKHLKDLLSKPGVKVHNLRYGGLDDHRVVDVFYKDSMGSTSSPLFVYVHGGYWQMLDKSNSCSMVEPMLDRGYRVAVVDYNNCPQVTLPQLLEQFTQFLLWIFDYADETQATEIHFAGHSAGAHLLAQLLNMTNLISKERRLKVRTLFFICGVYDLRELWDLDPVNPNNIFGLDVNSAKDISPMLWPLSAENASWPSLHSHVLSAQHESVTFIEQSRSFSDKLTNAGFSVSFKVFENYDHFDIIEETASHSSRITCYLQKSLGLTN